MAIAFVRGTLTRDPFVSEGGKTLFAACSLKETYKDKSGETKLGGYHDVVAFGDLAQQIGALEQGDELEVKANIRYRPDERFVSKQDEKRNPFQVQFVVMDVISASPGDDEEEDLFPDA